MGKKPRKAEPGPPWHLNQIDMMSAISKEIGRQVGDIPMIPRYFNAMIAAADVLVEEFATPYRPVVRGMGVEAWMHCDETGKSSLYMLSVLNGPPHSEFGYPLDPADFGRCLGLLRAAPSLRDKLPALKGVGLEWSAIFDHWDELESLYNEEAESGKWPRTYKRLLEVVGKNITF